MKVTKVTPPDIEKLHAIVFCPDFPQIIYSLLTATFKKITHQPIIQVIKQNCKKVKANKYYKILLTQNAPAPNATE